MILGIGEHKKRVCGEENEEKTLSPGSLSINSILHVSSVTAIATI
jgi:hypothetical protein